ncbi:MAG: hypothetical protein WCK58_03250 [Chloroflexota bacterium]
MARIIFPADNAGEAKAYIRAVTGATSISIPAGPPTDQLGQVLLTASTFVSVSASASIGFGFADVGGSVDSRVLLQDYWFGKEIDGGIPEVNSWTFAAGFRVGVFIVGYKSDMVLGLGQLAAKATIQGLNVQLQVLRVGMPKGPNVPVGVAFPVALNIDNYGELKIWEGAVVKYVEEHRDELAPVLVSASVNINGERLMNDAPGVRYALWRIANGQTLRQGIALLSSGKAPGVGEGEVRAVYSAVFRDPHMVVAGDVSENRPVGPAEKQTANNWLTGFRNI